MLTKLIQKKEASSVKHPNWDCDYNSPYTNDISSVVPDLGEKRK